MKTSNTADRIRRTPGEFGGTAGESGAFVGTLEKREELQENLVYTRKRRSFKVTPGKLEELWERLVEMRGTPKKGGETPERRGEPVFDGCFLGKLCQVVRCFHGCFMPP